MGGGIVVADGAVAGAGDDSIFVNEESADGYFAGISGSAGFFEGELHVIEIGWHAKKEE